VVLSFSISIAYQLIKGTKVDVLKSTLIGTLLVPLIILTTPNAIAQQETESNSIGMLAYIHGGDLWVMELPDGEAKQLTTYGRNRAPRWSPSGRWLAYRKDGQLWMMRSSGADAKALNGGVPVNAFAWSPRSDALAYTTHKGSLRVASAEEWHERELVEGIGEGSGVLSVAWSPDGEWLAYALRDQPEKYAGLWRIRADGSGATELLGGTVVFGEITQGPNPGAIVAAWSPDGERILYWSDPFSASLLADGTPLMTIPAVGGEPSELVKWMLAYPDFLAFPPDGKLLAVTEGGGRITWSNKRIAVVDLSSRKFTYLTEEGVAACSPAWSPDGEQIAYVAAPDIGHVLQGEAEAGVARRRIWVMNKDGSGKRQLTPDADYRDERPLWSADGGHILFARLDREGRASMWLMLADGGELRRVVDELSPPPSWFGYYGHINWGDYFDWWTGATPTVLPVTGGVLSKHLLSFIVCFLAALAGLVLKKVIRKGVMKRKEEFREVR
jgi:Tol biopolymer transport system component